MRGGSMNDDEALNLFPYVYMYSPVIMVITGKDLESIVGLNIKAQEKFGVSLEEAIEKGLKAKDLYEIPAERASLIEHLKRRSAVNYEGAFKRKDGKTIYLDVYLSLRFDKKGNIIGTIGHAFDITDKKEAEGDLKEFLFKAAAKLQDELIQYDPVLEKHTQRVMILSEKIGRSMGMNNIQLLLLGTSVYFHDIGKKNVENSVLNNGRSYLQGDSEREAIKLHCKEGARILKDFPKKCIDVAKYHHERWDGRGYYGMQDESLKGENIPLFARIVALADSYDSMTHERDYKLVMDNFTAIEEIKRCSGFDFDEERIFQHNKKSLIYLIERESEDHSAGTNIPMMVAKECINAIRNIKPGAKLDYEEMIDKCLDYTNQAPEFVQRIKDGMEEYLVKRLQKEEQFDPNIAKVFIEYLESAEDPLR